MRVLHVITTLQTGGAEKLLTQIAPGLQRRGFEADVAVFAKAEGRFCDLLRERGVKVHIFSRYGAIYSPIHIIRLWRLMRHYDVVHAHNTAPQIFASLAHLLARKPLLVTTEHNTSNRRRAWPWYLPLDRWMYRRYDKIICISGKAEDNLRQYLGRRPYPAVTIPNGIDLGEFMGHTAEARNDGKTVVTMVAAFRWEKDQPTLIRAISRLPEHFHLQLIGDGPRRGEYEALIKELGLDHRVHLLGVRSDVPRLLRASDIIVMSSHFEGLSLSSVEGMASGRPFIASAVDGLREVVSGAGVLFAEGDDEALAREIHRLAEDKEYTSRVTEDCLQRAQQYDIERTIDGYAEVYRQLQHDKATTRHPDLLKSYISSQLPPINNASPRVTVIMGIYNCAPTLPEALESMLAQTFQDFKVIMYDDGSSDDTRKVAQSYVDRYPERLSLIGESQNHGLGYALNRCLELVDTPYTARMDGDDISLPLRLEREVRYLDQHPEMAIVSTRMQYFDEGGIFRDGSTPEGNAPTRRAFLTGTPFCHAPAVVRTEAYRAVGGYNVDALRVEDYDLWSRMWALGYRGYVIGEALYMMRDDRAARARRTFSSRLLHARYVSQVVRRLGFAWPYQIYALRPVLVGLLPRRLYRWLHQNK